MISPTDLYEVAIGTGFDREIRRDSIASKVGRKLFLSSFSVKTYIEACPRKPSGRSIEVFNSGLPGGPYTAPPRGPRRTGRPGQLDLPTPQGRTVLIIGPSN